MSENSLAYKKYKKYKLKYKESKHYHSMVMNGGVAPGLQVEPCTETNANQDCLRDVKDKVVQKYNKLLRKPSKYSCLPSIDLTQSPILTIMNFEPEKVQNGKIKGQCQAKEPDRKSLWTQYLQPDKSRHLFVSRLLKKYLNLVAENFIDNQKKIFKPSEPTLDENNFFIQKLQLPSESRIAVVGDLHGGFQDLMVFIKSIHKLGFFNENYQLKDNHYIFSLGDMVDRGPSSLQVIFFLLLLKNENPSQVFIINGNHEKRLTYQKYGRNWMLKLHVLYQAGNIGDNVYNEYYGIFKPFWYLPRAIFVRFHGMDKWIQFCHGGLDGYEGYDTDKRYGLHSSETIKKFLSDSSLHLMTLDQNTYQKDGLRWSDFTIIQRGDSIDPQVSRRGATDNIDESNVGNLYGIYSTNIFLQTNNLECIIRGHQDYVTGFAILPKVTKSQNTPTDCESVDLIEGSFNQNTIQTDIYMNVKNDETELNDLPTTPFQDNKFYRDNYYNGDQIYEDPTYEDSVPLLCSIKDKKKFSVSETPTQKVSLDSTNFSVLTTSNCKQARRGKKLDNSFVIVTKSKHPS